MSSDIFAKAKRISEEETDALLLRMKIRALMEGIISPSDIHALLGATAIRLASGCAKIISAEQLKILHKGLLEETGIEGSDIRANAFSVCEDCSHYKPGQDCPAQLIQMRIGSMEKYVSKTQSIRSLYVAGCPDYSEKSAKELCERGI